MLLDLAAMDPYFERVFGDAGVRRAWFNQMIQSALVTTVTGAYSQFGAIGMAALTMTSPARPGARPGGLPAPTAGRWRASARPHRCGA